MAVLTNMYSVFMWPVLTFSFSPQYLAQVAHVAWNSMKNNTRNASFNVVISQHDTKVIMIRYN